MSETGQDKSRFTYGDYLEWPDDERWELIDGVPYNMTPAPSRRHQQMSGELVRQIGNFLRDHNCEGYAAPFDVRLPEADELDEDVTNVVQPDIVVVCDVDKLDDRGCRGAPDFIIEIVSPSTAAKDQIEKPALYERSGVKEYWVVHPTDNLVTIRLLQQDGRYGVPVILEGKGCVEVRTLPGLLLDLNRVFGNKSG